LLAKKEKEWKD